MQESSDGGKGGGKRPAWGRKQEVIEGVNELIDELKDIDNAIANQACPQICVNSTARRAISKPVVLKSAPP